MWPKITQTGDTNKSRNLMLLGDAAVTTKQQIHSSPTKTTTFCEKSNKS